MRAVIQRVTEARVEVDGRDVSRIGAGFLILLGVEKNDTEAHASHLARKTAALRIFDDDEGRLNRNVIDAGGSVLVVSQFTLYGDCRRGNRPSYDRAARPEAALHLYEYFVGQLRETGLPVETGTFRASMKVHLINDGPVTLIVDSDRID
jgi:D-aminoacyl-tRNA deacylase